MISIPAFCVAVLLAGSQLDAEEAHRNQQIEAANASVPKSLAEEFNELAPALVESLDDPDEDVRRHVSAALVSLGPDAVPALLKAIDGNRAKLRAEAARVIGRIASNNPGVARGAIPVLLKALKDDDKHVKQSAALAISQIVERQYRGNWPQTTAY